jgi:predicted metalloprotease
MFVALILGDTEDRWTEIFAANGRTYHPPKLRLFAGSEPTPCAFARSAMGPFYCPRDQRVYLDTAFFNDLQNKFGGCSSSKACQFSEAYVIAHEVGHHVQDELGILPRVMQAQQAASSQAEANQLQMRVELQADCLAGVWANRAQQKHDFLEPGDVDQALQTASAIGDDRLQKEMQGYVVPDGFTHGTSAQRKHWFMNGFNSGQLSACDTMSADTL